MNGPMPEPVSGAVSGRIAGRMRGPMPQTNSGPVRDLVRHRVADLLSGLVRYPVQYPVRDTVRATMRGTMNVLSQNLSDEAGHVSRHAPRASLHPPPGAVTGCGTDIHADWSYARMFDDSDDETAEHLRTRLGLAGSRLVVLVSERTPPTGRIPWVLELAQRVMSPAGSRCCRCASDPTTGPCPKRSNPIPESRNSTTTYASLRRIVEPQSPCPAGSALPV